MPNFPSQAPTSELAALFPTRLPDPEELVYQYVHQAATASVVAGVPALRYYATERPGMPTIPVVRGWPAYPGKVPAIGVALGPETEESGADVTGGGYAGEVTAYDDDGEVLGIASYFAEPLYSTVIVELIHENRDERDRLHNELRRVLFPLRTKLTHLDRQISRVRVDAEKSEVEGGPPAAEAPFVMYVSLFTVHVYYEMLEAREVVGRDGLVTRIDVGVVPTDTGS